MKCANCGKEINTSDAFCPYCGEQLIGFGIRNDSAGSADDEDLTFSGSYEDQEGGILSADRVSPEPSGSRGYDEVPNDQTYLDRSTFERKRSREEERTLFDSSGVNEFHRIAEDEITYRGTSHRPEQAYGTFFQDNYRQMPSEIPYAGQSSGREKDLSPGRANNRGIRIAAAVIAVIALAALFGWFFLSRSNKASLETLTYDELLADYELSSENSDPVKNAYFDNVRFEFEDIVKGNSGYKATAVIYSPDMEEIYQQTTVQDEVIDKLKRLSEEDLDKSQKIVLLNDRHNGLTDNSAETLKDLAEDKYLSPEAYAGQSGKTASSASEQSSQSVGSPDSSNTVDSGQKSSQPIVQNAADNAPQISDGVSDSNAGTALVLTGASATSTLYEKGYDHSPSNVLDGKLSTAWVEGAAGQGSGECITVTFNGSYTISTMTINAGYQKSARLYERNSRPKTITLFFSDGSNESVALADTNSTQTVSINPVTTTSVTLQIDSVYAGSVYQDTCISEIRFG